MQQRQKPRLQTQEYRFPYFFILLISHLNIIGHVWIASYLWTIETNHGTAFLKLGKTLVIEQFDSNVVKSSNYIDYKTNLGKFMKIFRSKLVEKH